MASSSSMDHFPQNNAKEDPDKKEEEETETKAEKKQKKRGKKSQRAKKKKITLQKKRATRMPVAPTSRDYVVFIFDKLSICNGFV